MVGAACPGSLLARPNSGIAARLPQVAPSNSPCATDPLSFLLPARQWQHHGASSLVSCRPPLITRYASTSIAGEKILKTELTPSLPIPNAFLIANICPTFSPAAAPRISNRHTKLLEIELTRSQQTREHFLIATICPTFLSAALPAFLIGTRTIKNRAISLTTNEKRFSNRNKITRAGNSTRARCSKKSSRSSNSQRTDLNLRVTNHHSPITIYFTIELSGRPEPASHQS